MKTVARGIVVALAVGLSAVGESAPLRYEIVNDRADCVYDCGAEARFRVTVTDDGGQAVTSGRVTAELDDCGPRQLASAVWDLAATNEFEISGRLDEPGFLRLRLKARDTEDRIWGVAYEPGKIRKGSPSPADFDAYWAGERARLAAEVPLDPQMTLVPEKSSEGWDFYRISFATFGRRVHGFMTVPTDRTLAPFPVNFQVAAAGMGNWSNTIYPNTNSICVFFSVFPFEPHWNWREAGLQEKYDALEKASKEKYGTGYPCAGVSEGREACFFHPVLLGIDRAVDWVAAREDVDPRRFRYRGTSQGGGLGIMLTALNRHFTRAVFYVPALTDTLGCLAGRLSGWPKMLEKQRSEEAKATVKKVAPYFDAANFASRITCPVRIAVGFSDPTCPPSAVYATYNEIRSDKRILHGIGMTHSCFGRFYDELGRWVESDGDEVNPSK